MIQINYSPYLGQEIKRRQEELINEAALINLAGQARKSQPQNTGKSKVLASIGTKLVSLGTNLEERYGIKPEAKSRVNPG